MASKASRGTEQSRSSDRSVVFVPTDLSILARSVTNVYVRNYSTSGTEKKRKGTRAKKGKRSRGKNCGERSRTEAEDLKSEGKLNRIELLLSEGRTLTGA